MRERMGDHRVRPMPRHAAFGASERVGERRAAGEASDRVREHSAEGEAAA